MIAEDRPDPKSSFEMSRNSRRHRVYLDVELFDSRRGRWLAKASDVSENGMSVYAAAQLLPNELLKLLFQLPGNVSVAIEGVVKNSSSGRYGIRFIGVTDVQRRQLRAYLAELAATDTAE